MAEVKGKKPIIAVIVIVSVIIMVSFIPIINASVFGGVEFSVGVNSPSYVDVYEGDPINNQFSAIITNNGKHCDITCEWSTSMNTHGSEVKVAPNGGKTYFPFDLVAQGNNGEGSYMLTVTCNRIHTPSQICLSDPNSYTSNVLYFNYLYNGDGTCTTEKEKCTAYQSYLSAPNDCKCSSDKECNPTSSRGSDSYGCSTYCGNKITEKQFGETCGNCPGDVGKCDGVSCATSNECEGKYCVSSAQPKCSDKPYIVGDGICTVGTQESCKISPLDCKCGANQICNNYGVCETSIKCGDGKCDSAEQGLCAVDCDWCGDGECKSPESCKTCTKDCGVCKEVINTQQQDTSLVNKEPEKKEYLSDEEYNNKLLGKVTQEVTNESMDKNKLVTIIGIVIILLLIILVITYLLRKKQKESDSNDKKPDKKHEIKEIEKRIKEHKKEIRKMKNKVKK